MNQEILDSGVKSHNFGIWSQKGPCNRWKRYIFNYYATFIKISSHKTMLIREREQSLKISQFLSFFSQSSFNIQQFQNICSFIHCVLIGVHAFCSTVAVIESVWKTLYVNSILERDLKNNNIVAQFLCA